MKFLEDLGFQKEDIKNFEDSTADVMLDTIKANKKLVLSNANYLKELGVKNIVEIFNAYYELFLIDHSNFVGIFNKYEKDDLVDKLAKNVAIVEYL